MTLSLPPQTTALVLIDLQQGIVARELAPHSGADVVRNCAELAAAFRERGALVVYVHVDLAKVLRLPVDEPMRAPDAPPPPPEASELVAEAGWLPGDLLITKRQWGAFFGTDLERQLRHREIGTIVLGGIATNFGVESTARAAAGLGFELVVVEDAMTSMSREMHQFAVQKIFPRIARVRSTTQVLQALGGQI